METQNPIDKPLITWSEMKEKGVEALQSFLGLISVYVVTTWGIIKDPRTVIASTFNLHPKPLEVAKQDPIGQLQRWWRAPRSAKKQVRSAWFDITPVKTYLSQWAYFNATIGFLCFVMLCVGYARTMFPHTIQKPDASIAYEKAMTDSTAVWNRGDKITAEERQQIDTTKKDLDPKSRLYEDGVRQVVVWVFLVIACWLVCQPLAWHYSIRSRELFAVGMYGLSLALLVSIPVQLLTDVPASAFTMAGNILFVVNWVGVPAYYVARYIKLSVDKTKKGWLITALACYQTGVLFTLAATWKVLGPMVNEQIDVFIKAH